MAIDNIKTTSRLFAVRDKIEITSFRSLQKDGTEMLRSAIDFVILLLGLIL